MQVYLERLEPSEIRLHALCLACVGLGKPDAPDSPLFDTSESPWSNRLFSQHLTIERKDYKEEIDRRWLAKLTKLSRDTPSVQNPRPRPNGWPIAKLLNSLRLNPIDLPEEVNYLVSLVGAETAKAQAQLQPPVRVDRQPPGTTSSSKKKAAKKTSGLNWTGKTAMLRLIHCLIDDSDTRSAYSSRTNVGPTRYGMENRKSIDKRPKDVWELLSDKWNNEDFTCTTVAMIGAKRDDFRYPITIDHAQVKKYTPATPKMHLDPDRGLQKYWYMSIFNPWRLSQMVTNI